MPTTQPILTADDFGKLTNDEIRNKIITIDVNIRQIKLKNQQLANALAFSQDRLNQMQINPFTKRPLLTASIMEIHPNNGGIVLFTSRREKIFLSLPGLINIKNLNVGDLVAINKDNFLIINKLSSEYDHRIKSMEVIQKPNDNFCEIGGLNKQIKELKEIIISPFTQKHLYKAIGIQQSKGVLLYGPTGTGKTTLARCAANAINGTFIKLSATVLVQKYAADGIKIIRDIFKYSKTKAPAVIFIDEIDAIGMKRMNINGNTVTDSILIELLNCIDGFTPNDDIKIIAATNRVDILDPALMRSGRIDRKIKCLLPNEIEREQILKIHLNKMNINYSKNINFKLLAKMTNDLNGAQLKAIVVEAGMNALRRNDDRLIFQDFIDGINMVKTKKTFLSNYYN